MNYVQRPIIALKSQLVIGDGNSDGSVFDSAGFRGVRLFSVDNMYPDSQQGYAPTVRGMAKTDAKVVIRQNGYVIYQVYVPPGPFVINDLNPPPPVVTYRSPSRRKTALSSSILFPTPHYRCSSVKAV